MSWQVGLLMLFGFLGGFCLLWIIIVESKYQGPVIREEPQPDSRRDAYRNFNRDWKTK